MFGKSGKGERRKRRGRHRSRWEGSYCEGRQRVREGVLALEHTRFSSQNYITKHHMLISTPSPHSCTRSFLPLLLTREDLSSRHIELYPIGHEFGLSDAYPFQFPRGLHPVLLHCCAHISKHRATRGVKGQRTLEQGRLEYIFMTHHLHPPQVLYIRTHASQVLTVTP